MIKRIKKFLKDRKFNNYWSSSPVSQKEKDLASYLYFIEGYSLKEICQNMYKDNQQGFFNTKIEFISTKINYDYGYNGNIRNFIVVDELDSFGNIPYGAEPIYLIEKPLSKTIIFEYYAPHKKRYYFSVYSSPKGEIEYGPFSSYRQAIHQIDIFKAKVMQKQDVEIRYYSDPYSDPYRYKRSDKILNEVINLER